MTSKADDSIEVTAIEEKTKDDTIDLVDQYDSSPPPQRTSGESHWLVQNKKHIGRQYKVYSCITVVVVVLGLVVNALWVAPLVADHNQRIRKLEDTRISNSESSQQVDQTGMICLEDLEDKLEELLRPKLAEYETKLQAVQQKLNQSQRQYEELLQKAQEKEELLEHLLARAETFEQDHNDTIDRVSALESSYEEISANLERTREEIESTSTGLGDRLNSLEANLTHTAEETAILQEALNTVQRDIIAINTTSYSSQLETRITLLERNSATVSNLDSLDKKLNDHTSSSAVVHTQLTDSINDNQDSIRSNSGRITSLETVVSAGVMLRGSRVFVTASIALVVTMTIKLF